MSAPQTNLGGEPPGTLPPNLPSSLYHYTSIRGVEGILKARAVWAPRLQFMNDSREWLYALDLVKQALHKRGTRRTDEHWPSFIAQLAGSLWRIEGLFICVFSLTAMPNQLSQWRAYCPPEGGYNLKFQVDLLAPHLDRHNFQLRQCVYEFTEQERLIGIVVDEVLTLIGTITDDNSIDSAVDSSITGFVQRLPPVAAILKHPDFSEEQEWRATALVSSYDEHMEYRIKGSVAIPHCVLGLESPSLPFPITEITIGPNAYQDLALTGLHALIQRTKLPINVLKSTTPLRNL